MLELLAFFTGTIIMIIEIVGVRIISPFLGSSFIVCTSTIGIIMFALSIGYYIGGKIADKKLNTCLLSIFYLVTGIYLLFTAITQVTILENISNLNIN